MTVKDLVSKCQGNVKFRFYGYRYFLPASVFANTYQSFNAWNAEVGSYVIDKITYTVLVTITLEDESFMCEEVKPNV